MSLEQLQALLQTLLGNSTPTATIISQFILLASSVSVTLVHGIQSVLY